jgi:uncharacterized protein
MKIFIDIGHPAHVHYFKNLIAEMKKFGHHFLITARDKEVTHSLLKAFNIEYISRGKGRNSLFGKLIYLLKADLKIFNLARKWKPDVFLSFGSPYAAHTASILGKPHIALTDTEHAKLGILAFAPFSEVIITPDTFFKPFGTKHLKFSGYFELCYLHPNFYKPDNSIRGLLNLDDNDKFVLFRYISWKASHDIGQSGIPEETKLNLINLFLSKGYKVFISAEGDLVPEFWKYRLIIPPERIHGVLQEADFFIGESGTMATEASLLGTPSVYVNTLDAGVFRDEVEYGLLYSFRSANNLLFEVEKLLAIENLSEIHSERRKMMLADKIDVTSFLIWFVQNYPLSYEEIKNDPTSQNKFK